MCCRYYFDEITMNELEKIVEDVDRRVNQPFYQYGDVCPTDHAPILTSGKNGLQIKDMRWGFKNSSGTSLVINATSEHALEKPLFQNHLASRRCIIPAKGFYEWNADKQKFTFKKKDATTIYMAGIYNLYDNEDHFVIFTTKANSSMAPVHDRMPLILSQEDMIHSWLAEGMEGLACLKKASPELSRETDYEQLSLILP